MPQATEREPQSPIRVLTGPVGSGKSATLLAEAVSVARTGQQVLFLVATSMSSRRIRDELLRKWPDVEPNVRVTTPSGWAVEIVRRASPQLRFVTGNESRTAFRRILETETNSVNSKKLWPTLFPQLQSETRRGELLTAASEFRAAGISIEDVVGRLSLRPLEIERWRELSDFVVRATATMNRGGWADSVETLRRANAILHSEQREFWEVTYPRMYVDDFQRLLAPEQRLVTAHRAKRSIATDLGGPTWATTPSPSQLGRFEVDIVELQPFVGGAGAPATVTQQLALLPHPSLEADTIISALIIEHQKGTPWSEMAIVLPTTDFSLHSSLDRSARRLGLPLTGVALKPSKNLWATAVSELIIDASQNTDAQARLDLALGQEQRSIIADVRNVSRRANAAWRAVARKVLSNADDESVHLVTACVNRIAKGASPSDALAAPVTLPGEGVLVCGASQIAGESRAVVVIARAVEGAWPDPGPLGIPFFDPELLSENEFTDVPSCRNRWVTEQSRRFEAASAVARKRVLAVAAPRPGVLVSRFVEHWDRITIPAGKPGPRKQTRVAPNETASTVACFPTGKLRLSASQLDTFENCPLSFAYQYVAGIRGEGSVSASVGTIVHAALEAFLSPESDRTENATLDDLLSRLDEAWDPAAFPYRPQEADYRKRAEEWLRNWFTNELPMLGSVIAVEHRFTVDVGPHELTGSIDRISTTKNGIVEIVDYKTGARPARSIDQDNLQLASYYLAAQGDSFLKTFGEPERLRLHYLVDGKDIDQPVTPEHFRVTTERILSDAEKILTEEYEPSIDADCEYCSFQRICPIQKQGREVPVGLLPTDRMSNRR